MDTEQTVLLENNKSQMQGMEQLSQVQTKHADLACFGT